MHALRVDARFDGGVEQELLAGGPDERLQPKLTDANACDCVKPRLKPSPYMPPGFPPWSADTGLPKPVPLHPNRREPRKKLVLGQRPPGPGRAGLANGILELTIQKAESSKDSMWLCPRKKWVRPRFMGKGDWCASC